MLLNIYYCPSKKTQWLSTEDFGRKKEIRAQMYKLREERLRNFYVNEMESDHYGTAATTIISHANTKAKTGDTTNSHEHLVQDQSYQSFKTKEVRDSESPTRYS